MDGDKLRTSASLVVVANFGRLPSTPHIDKDGEWTTSLPIRC